MSEGDKARWIFLDLRRSGVVYETHQVLYLQPSHKVLHMAHYYLFIVFFFFSLLVIENFCHLIFNHLESTLEIWKKISIKRYNPIRLF